MAISPAQQFWFLAPLFSLLALACVLWLNWGRPKLREWRMAAPFEAFLTLNPAVGYDSWTDELHVPPEREVEIQVRLRHRLHYTQHEFIFGFEGDTAQKPEVVRVLNHFIVVGQGREMSPHTNPNHYIDYRGHYHIKERYERTKPNVTALGFKVKTRKPGRYPVHLRAITDGGDSGPLRPLTLIVEERSSASSGAETL